MKKLLTCLTAGLLVASAGSSVVACSQKAIASLNDKAYLLKTTDPAHKEKYDVMRWSNDVLTADTYKKEFISLAKEHIILAEKPWKWLDVIKGYKDEDEQPTKGSSTLISQFIVDYQKSSNTGEKNDDFLKPEFYDQELTYRIYDENNEKKLVTSFNDENNLGKWTDELNNLKFNEQGDVLVVHLKIAIETPVSEHFIGARQHITDENKEEQLKNYYKNINVKENKIPETSAFDYRYDVQFYFSFG